MTFQLNSNGATFSDRGGNSHGDSLNSPKLTTALSSDKNFAGEFALDTTDVSTDPTLSKQNPQASTVTPPVSKIPVTVEDGLVTFGGAGSGSVRHGGASPTASVTGRGSTWTTALPARSRSRIMLYGHERPEAARPPATIKLFHEGSSPNPITTTVQRVDPAHRGLVPNASPSPRSASNFKIVGWLNHNGYIRGGY